MGDGRVQRQAVAQGHWMAGQGTGRCAGQRVVGAGRQRVGVGRWFEGVG
jgi:hypothetical protein